MGIRKPGSYSKMKVVPYTRTSKKKNRAYIKAVPPSKIVKFEMGNLVDYRAGKYPFQLTAVSLENAQIRNNALEACRQYINKKLDKDLAGQYRFRVIPYPHHIQRENKMLTGAGADRMQTGMQLSFGKAIAKAALVKVGSPIFSISVSTQKGILITRESFNQIRPKLPCRIRVDFVDHSRENKQ